MICHICNKKFKNNKDLSNHISRTHKITREEYYLKYISTDPLDGKCHNDECKNTTKFETMTIGFRKFCSPKCAQNSNETKKKFKESMLNKYGVEYTAQSKELREKAKQTCLNRYGTENVSQIKEFREKVKQTCLNKYGTESPLQSEEVKKKSRETCLNKYGKEYITQTEDFKEKSKQTLLTNYGVENPMQSEEVKDKHKQTCLENHGVEYITLSETFKEKSKQTLLINYGVENAMQSEEIKEKVKQTMINKYGVEYASQSDEFKEKSKQTCLERYGTEYSSQSYEVKKSIFKKYFDSLFTSDRLQNKVVPNFTFDDYKGIENKYSWICTKCNTTFEDHLDNGKIPRCPSCYPPMNGTSKSEQEIYNFVKQYFSDVENGNRSIISPMELDIYIPSKQFAIEFDGLFWHSELNGKGKNYHLNKTLACSEKDIQLIHIFEDEWVNKQEIIESIIKSKLNLITNKIFARKCKVKEVNNEESIIFLDRNHLQGSINNKHIGLYYNDELVSLLTYGRPRFNNNYEVEILRFCNKIDITVVGGLSKLISQIKNKSIISYVDKRYSNGNAYRQCGFELIGKSNPSYYYVKEYNRFNRMSFQKHLLESKLDLFDPNLTEWQNMQLNGYDRIWDCGCNIYTNK